MATFGRRKTVSGRSFKTYLSQPSLYIDFSKHKDWFLTNERHIKGYIMNFVADEIENKTFFENYSDELVIQKHFEKELIAEGLKLFRMIQLMYFAKPIALQRVWWEREKAGFKKADKKIVESALADLVINGMIEVTEVQYPGNLIVESLTPTIAIKRTRVSRVENTFTKTEVDRFKFKAAAKDRLVIKKGQLYEEFERSESDTAPSEENPEPDKIPE